MIGVYLPGNYDWWKGHMIPLDVVTSLTYERYCGAYRGQWLMPPGGLPVEVITGKWEFAEATLWRCL